LLQEPPEQVIQHPRESDGGSLLGSAPGGADSVSGGVFSGDVEGLQVGEPGERFGVRASGLAAIGAAVEGSGGEVVQVGAGVADASRPDDGSEEVERLAGGCSGGEWEDVLVAA
jgi:hypothetical protein